MAGKTKVTKKVLAMLDSRVVDDNTGLLVKKNHEATMLDIFGTEDKAAVASFVAKKLAMGHNNKRIAEEIKEEFGIDWSWNKVDVVKKLCHRMWRAEIAHTVNDHIARQVAAIDFQIAELWDSWEKSKKGNKKVKKHTAKGVNVVAPDTDYELEETTEDTEENAGDPKYMQMIIDLNKQRIALLGLEVGKRTEKAQDQGKSNIMINVVGSKGEDMTDVMSAILNPKGLTQLENEPIQQAEVVSTKPVEVIPVSPEEADKEDMINRMFEDIMG